jgi:hypothetical protein
LFAMALEMVFAGALGPAIPGGARLAGLAWRGLAWG